ncbi:MAG: hypothetical protein ACRD3Q_13675 [Terriglobales bacterium]
MTAHKTFPRKHQEAGVALLIAILVLLLVSAVGLALVAASGTESSLAGNYRSSTSVYYAGLAGLEEARGRMLPSNPDYFNNTVANFIPTAGSLAVGQVRYILNPAPGEVVAPTTPGSTYADTEYQTESVGGLPPNPATTQTIRSVWTAGAPIAALQGPLYKWVRITAATEQSLNVDVNADGAKDPLTPLYYDPAHLDPVTGQPKPSLIVNALPPATAKQAFEVTTLSVLPNGSQKLMQYVVTQVSLNLNFPSALTLGGTVGAFNGANSNPYQVNGTDGSGNPPNTVPGCAIANPPATQPAIGVTDPVGGTADKTTVISGIPRPTHYTGGGLSTPSVGEVSLNSTLSTPASLDQLVTTISQGADLVLGTPLAPGATIQNFSDSQLPPSMFNSPCVPATVVVNGNFSQGPSTGCGLLVVTGDYNYQGKAGWDGVILVIGSGTTTFNGKGGGNGEFDGAFFAATTKDANYNELPTLGSVNFDISGGGGNGIYYNSCWINRVQQPTTFKMVSFRELPN